MKNTKGRRNFVCTISAILKVWYESLLGISQRQGYHRTILYLLIDLLLLISVSYCVALILSIDRIVLMNTKHSLELTVCLLSVTVLAGVSYGLSNRAWADQITGTD
jgi:hypothetical protein